MEKNKIPVGAYINLDKPLIRPVIEESKDLKKNLDERIIDWKSIEPCGTKQVGTHVGINNLNIIIGKA